VRPVQTLLMKKHGSSLLQESVTVSGGSGEVMSLGLYTQVHATIIPGNGIAVQYLLGPCAG